MGNSWITFWFLALLPHPFLQMIPAIITSRIRGLVSCKEFMFITSKNSRGVRPTILAAGMEIPPGTKPIHTTKDYWGLNFSRECMRGPVFALENIIDELFAAYLPNS